MPQRRATYRVVPVLLASLSAVAVILQGGAFPATAQVPVGTSTPLATGVASVAPSITMTVTATPVATVSPTLSPTVATSPSVTVTSTATVAPSASPALSATSGDPAQSVRTRKVDTSTVGNVAFVSIAQGVAYTCGLTSTDIAYCWGYNASGQLGDGSNTDRLTPTLVAVSGGLTFTTIAAGSAHTCGLTSTRTAYCWGNGPFGQLGDGSNSNRLTPTLVAVSGGLTFTTIAAGNAHTCGLTSTGIAYCWGTGNVGQLGDGSNTNRLTPTLVAVSGGLTFTTIAAGSEHTCAIQQANVGPSSVGRRSVSAGAAYCWGRGNAGQLGDGTTTDHNVPTAVSGGHTFSTITAGYAHTCGLTSTGIAYCWGTGNVGQLGDGSNTNRLTPTLVAVSGGLTFTTIAAGSEHTCAIQQANVGPSSVGRRSVSAGAAYCWGYNNAGQLGDGTTTDHNVPTAVDTTFTFSTISAGEGHTCAIQQANVGAVSVGRRSVSEAAAYCWGKNTNGQLGNATNVSSTLPVAVARNLSYTAIGAGYRHTCGITAAATYCWGWNAAGQLGDGTTSDRNTPILDDAPASSGGSSSAPEATAVPTRTAVPTATPVPLKYTWTRDANPASITVTSNRGYSRTIARAALDPVTGARTFKEWVRNSVTFDVYGVDENGLLVWADPSDTAIVSQIDWRQLLTMDMPAGAVDAIPVATPADGRLLWDVKGTGTIYVVGSDRFLHAIPDLRTFQASYTWANVIPITPTQLRLMPVGAPIPAVR